MSLARDLAAALDPAVTFRDAFGFDPLPWQAGYLRETRPTVVLKGRQVGASLSAAALGHPHRALLAGRQRGHRVARRCKQSTEIDHARPGRPRARSASGSSRTARRCCAWPTARASSACPAPPGSVRGWTARLLILDEAAYIEHETFVAARALVATGGRLVVQSTPADESGDFHAIVTGDDPGWARFTVPQRLGADHHRRRSSRPSGGRWGPTPSPPSTSARSARPARPCSRSTGSPRSILPEAAA